MKKTQQERAQSYFERHSKVAELFGTKDGFLFEKIQDALAHSTTLENKGLEVYNANGTAEAFEAKAPVADQPDILKLSVVKLEAALPEITNVEALQGYLDAEQKATTPRITAIKAIEARIEALTNPA